MFLDVDVSVGSQASLVVWFVLPVQVNERIDLECSGLLRLRQVECADGGQFAIRQGQNDSYGKMQQAILTDFVSLIVQMRELAREQTSFRR